MPAIIGHNLQHRGDWSGIVQYYQDNMVRLNGSTYICILNNLNQTPPNATYWELLADKGDPGTDGTDGIDGVDGAAGVGVPSGGTTGQVLSNIDNTNFNTQWVNPGVGSGDVVGPAGATDNALVRFDTSTGKLVQNGLATLSDAGELTIPKGTITASSPHVLSETWNSGGVTFIGTDINITDTASAAASRVFRVRVGATVIAAVSKTQLISAVGSVIAGNAPGLTFEGFLDTGFGVNGDNLAIFESGTIVLNLTSLNKEFRIPSDFVYAFSSATNNNSAADTFLRRAAAATLQMGSDASTPVNQRFKAADGSGTNRPGANLTISAGQPTGSGTAGNLIFQVSTAGSSGSGVQTAADRMILSSVGEALKVMTAAAGVKGYVIKGAAGQTAPLFEIRDSTEAVLSYFDSRGAFVTPASTTAGAAIIFTAGVAPSAPTDGMMWYEAAVGFRGRHGGATITFGAGGGGGVTDGDKGDITVTASGATWTIDADVISAFGRTLTVAADASGARGILGVDPAGTDNSVNVTLAGAPTYITISGQVITRHPILNGDIDAAAGIVDTKLATIATAGKVSNSATTATSANTASAIVARDGSGNFSAGEITANITTANTGLHVLDTDASHDLILKPGSNLSADRTLTLTTGDSDRTVQVIGDGVVGETRSINLTIDGGGSAISTGLKGYIRVPYACTITGWSVLADQTGSIVVDVWKDTYANFPPLVGDSIAGSEKPTLSSAQKNEDTSLTTWTTTSVAAGDVIAFNVDSVATVTRVHVAINVRLA